VETFDVSVPLRLHSGTHVDAPAHFIDGAAGVDAIPLKFAEDFARLDGEAATLLVDRGVRLVGVDYLSVGDEDAHHVPLEAGMVPVEGLDLRAVGPGGYQLVCLPLRIVGADSAPGRAILIHP